MIQYRYLYFVLILSVVLELFVGVIDGNLLYWSPRQGRHDRIGGGVDTHIEEHPHLVQLENEGTKVFCGGSILTSTIILTAGHCVDDNSTLFVRAGATKASIGGSKILVRLIEIHPKYGVDNLIPHFDIAILKLKEPLEFSKTIQSISLATERDRKVSKNVGVVAGWGLTKFGTPTLLQHVLIPIISRKQCKSKFYSKYGHDHVIDETMFCAFHPNGRDTCRGDSGGSLTVNSKLYGVVSWGENPCGNKLYPGVYVKLTNPDIRKWIMTKVKELSYN